VEMGLWGRCHEGYEDVVKGGLVAANERERIR
jgi:hypothetical protein